MEKEQEYKIVKDAILTLANARDRQLLEYIAITTFDLHCKATDVEYAVQQLDNLIPKRKEKKLGEFA